MHRTCLRVAFLLVLVISAKVAKANTYLLNVFSKLKAICQVVVFIYNS